MHSRVILLLFFSLLLWNAALAEDIDRFFVTAINQSRGVEIRVYPDGNGASKHKQVELTGHYLPPECVSECMVVVGNSTSSARQEQSFVVALSLVKALGLLRVTVDATAFNEEHNIIDLSEPNCSSTSIYYIQGSYYIVCPNTDSNNIKLLELHLNATLNEYWLAPDYPYIGSVHNLTNTVYVDLPAQSGQFIFFATGYEVFYFRPLDGTVAELDIDLQGNECFATSIDYIGEWEMLVYCDNNRAVFVNINSESITDAVEYNKNGQPYVCPNPDVYLAVHREQRYIQYEFMSTQKVSEIPLPGRKFDNGICSGSQKVTLFAFTDRERGTQLLNASIGSIRSLSATNCTNYPCQPLVMLQDRYLVIREKREASWYTLILDANDNYSLVLEAQYTKADLMTVVEYARKQDGLHRSSSPDSHRTLIISLSIGCGSFSVLLSLAIFALIALYVRKKRKNSPVAIDHEQRRNLSEAMVPGTGSKGKGVLGQADQDSEGKPLLEINS